MNKSSPRLEAEASAETEIELKLTMSPANLAKVLKSAGKIDGVNAESRQTKRIVSTYFDTDDRRLQSKGLTLRIRDAGGERVQTLKSTGTSNSGMFKRDEWTTPLDDTVPDLSVLGTPAVRESISLILPQELVKLFKTDVRRTTMVIEHEVEPDDWARVELAFDKGRIAAGKLRQDISEVELELINGSTTALLDLAHVLADTASSILNLSSKVDRGFELCDGTTPLAVTACKRGLPKGISVEEGMTLIFRSALDHLLSNRSAAVSGADIEGVHQARIAIRRIGSAISVFDKFLSPDDTDPIKEDMRWLMDALAPARDLNVFLDEMLPAVLTDLPDDPDLKALMKVAKKERTAAYRKVRSAFSVARYTRATLTLASWIEEHG